MGLLDEAIREHLDLKRRRGADPSDVAREERDALGPAVREVRESMTGEEGPAPADGVAAAGDDAEAQHESEPVEASTTAEPTEPPAEGSEPAPADDQSGATQVFNAEDLFADEDRSPVPDPEAPIPGKPPAASDPDAIVPDPESP